MIGHIALIVLLQLMFTRFLRQSHFTSGWFSGWLERGDYWVLGTMILGYAIIQSAAHGKIEIKDLMKLGLLLLLPFAAAGQCIAWMLLYANDLGYISDKSEQVVVIEQKGETSLPVSEGVHNYYKLFFFGPCDDVWTNDVGQEIDGCMVYVDQQSYERIQLGDKVTVIEVGIYTPTVDSPLYRQNFQTKEQLEASFEYTTILLFFWLSLCIVVAVTSPSHRVGEKWG